MMHCCVVQITPDFQSQLYSLGLNSYFGESAYTMAEWPLRYWGRKIYRRLLKVKNEVDPRGMFTCHHCVGDVYEGAAAL